jgi:hypothetical protein
MVVVPLGSVGVLPRTYGCVGGGGVDVSLFIPGYDVPYALWYDGTLDGGTGEEGLNRLRECRSRDDRVSSSVKSRRDRDAEEVSAILLELEGRREEEGRLGPGIGPEVDSGIVGSSAEGNGDGADEGEAKAAVEVIEILRE